MSLMRRDPFEALLPLREAMSRIYEDNFFWPGRLELLTGQTFPLDVYESDDKQQYVVEANVAGFKPEELQVTAEDNTLTIHAVHKEESKRDKGSYVRHERYEGEMNRTITLPGPIEADKVEATSDHGVLKLRIPKAEGSRPRLIPIRVQELIGSGKH
jgi:HSP20 family protein